MKKNRLKKFILVNGKSITIEHSFDITQYLSSNRTNTDTINLYFFKENNTWYFVIGYDNALSKNTMYSAVYSMLSFDCPIISKYFSKVANELGFKTLGEFKEVINEAMEVVQ